MNSQLRLSWLPITLDLYGEVWSWHHPSSMPQHGGGFQLKLEALRVRKPSGLGLVQVGSYEVPPFPAGLQTLTFKIAQQKGISSQQVGCFWLQTLDPPSSL